MCESEQAAQGMELAQPCGEECGNIGDRSAPLPPHVHFQEPTLWGSSEILK